MSAGLTGVLGWVMLGSPLFDIRSVHVLGTSELPVEEVAAAADVTVGDPLLLLDTEQVHASVAALPRVASVQVSRTLDGTVRIEITERTPVAVRPAGDGIRLVDATGIEYATVADPPSGVPELRVADGGPADPAAMAAINVLVALPQQLRAPVVAVSAHSPTDVVLSLEDGREVRWGGVESADRKAAVLAALLTRPGQVYDVSSPNLPTVSGSP